MKFGVALLLAAFTWSSLPAQPVDVLPVRVGEGAQSLNGTWRFKYIASSAIGADDGFFRPSFDDTAWKTIAVPGNWELEGFAQPGYGDNLKEGTGLYRRTFTIAPGWRGQRVYLRFDGVLYGFTAWINGKRVGSWASSFNPATFDITDALAPAGQDNLLTVRVTTRSKGWAFDTFDGWALSGIFRDVTLFALPAVHLEDYTETTTLRSDGAAQLHVALVTSGAGDVVAHLVAPDGTPAGEATIATPGGRGAADLVVARPRLWTAETPVLYRLELDVESGGRTVQRYADRIGLRQVTVEDGVLKLNGRPIKLRGIDHHDIWPQGRVATEERLRHDLELVRNANINFIRTSHYPPHPRFLELCDEMGIYVDDEVPFIHGREHLKDPSYQDVLLSRARATVMRDKNRPSVILWSVGNENPITELGLNTGRYVKQLDPTRPITFPTMGKYFDENYANFPPWVDLYSPHYPTLKIARRYAQELTRPIVFTEYAHQRGLARSGTAVQDLWEVFYHSPRIAGGAIWMFQDQGILRATDDMTGVKDGDLMVWLDPHHYYDTHGFYAMDGIVYADRTPQVDYWQVRKVYSPVQVPERDLKVAAGAPQLTVHVENRYDFRSLAGFSLHWTLRRNRSALASGAVALSAASHQTESVAIPAAVPAGAPTDVLILELQCLDETRRSIYERSLNVDCGQAAGARWTAVSVALAPVAPTLETSEQEISVRTPGYRLTLNRRTGELMVLDATGQVIVSDFGPHVGRHPTINDMGRDRVREPSLWRGNLLRDVINLTTSVQTTSVGIEIEVAGRYPRPGAPEEAIAGKYTVVVARNGTITVRYAYVPEHASGEMLEVGFALALPAAYSEFRWVGQGPYAAYPGKDRLDEYGVFHLNRDDLYFPGNRRGVELAALANPAGAGVLLSGGGTTVDLENVENATILSQLAEVPGDESGPDPNGENVDIGSLLKAYWVKRIAGEFRLLPLANRWPAPLVQWFGSPQERTMVHRPFYRSYDQ